MTTLTLKKKDTAASDALAKVLQFRFVERKRRYILQALVNKDSLGDGVVHYFHGATPVQCSLNCCVSWVDVPLCPETFA